MEPLRVVVMGVSGCGKSSLGQALAQALGAGFIEGDRHHPPENVAHMAAGVPLTDADRAGWLATLADLLAQARQDGRPAVLACSALKRAYRDVLRRAGPLHFVLMTAPREVLAQRLAARSGHYMPASLLPSQLATLEPPQADEAAIVVDATRPLPVLVDTVLAQLRASTTQTLAP
ncbi:gluconokinase [Rhizobacter sp. AJA081-3]|uniref:gluconokinase n=1 Tax=Rhizobacter sp. AJA081-3 TaxID=2753607 RepID=UPI001ADF4B46|nr:gluconokinase [Rhizobacter sp. AJA081-3]QTN22274.1 gluconokinase [Rhizobacter sp. AJA081-3]